MATFARGLDAEYRVRTKLDKYGCTLQSNETLDHRFKLDWVVTQLPDTQRFFSLGVRVTSVLNNHEKMNAFLLAREDSQSVDKAIYIEMAPGVDLESGGSLVIFNALVAFLHDRAFDSTPCPAGSEDRARK